MAGLAQKLARPLAALALAVGMAIVEPAPPVRAAENAADSLAGGPANGAALESADNGGPAAGGLAEDLAAVKDEMRKEKSALRRVMRGEGDILAKLDALRGRIGKAGARLERLGRDREILRHEARVLAERRAELEARSKRVKSLMARRVRARHRVGRARMLSVILAAEDMGELSRRRKSFEALYRSDGRKVKELNQLRSEWHEASLKLEKREAELGELESLLAEQTADMEKEKAELGEMLRRIREEKEAHERMLAELKAGASRLQGVISEIDRLGRERAEPAEKESGDVGEEADAEAPGREAPGDGASSPKLSRQKRGAPEGTSALAGRRGSLCFPAPGPVRSGFGKTVHPEFKTVTMHNGVEISVPKGTPVKAVAPGAVRFAEWFRGYGNLVILDHGGGYYTVYARLASIAAGKGAAVPEGGLIGYSGDTGSIDGPSLYFEVRRHRTPLDPERWLGDCAL